MMMQSRKVPPCISGECPIGEIQKSQDSIKINSYVDAFIVVEAFSETPGYAKVQEKTLDKSGLGDLDPEIIFGMKRLFSQYREDIRKKSQK